MTIGIQNNNPGNIRNDGTKWQGMAADQSTGKGFVVFQEAKWGIRALAVNLTTYFNKLNLSTVRQVISRWAPPSIVTASGEKQVENDTEAYITAVSDEMRVGAEDQLDLHDYDTMYGLVGAIIHHENGKQPYDKATIDAALIMAGIVPTPKPLAKSRTVQGGAVAASGGVATLAISYLQQNPGVVTAVASPAATSISAVAQYAPWILGLVVLLAGAYVIYARIDDRMKGTNHA